MHTVHFARGISEMDNQFNKIPCFNTGKNPGNENENVIFTCTCLRGKFDISNIGQKLNREFQTRYDQDFVVLNAGSLLRHSCNNCKERNNCLFL